MAQLTTYEELIERISSDAELRTRLFEALGLSALPALYTRMDSFEETQKAILKTLKEQGEALIALREDFNALGIRVDRLETDVHSINSVVLGRDLEEKAANVLQSRLRSVAEARLRAIGLRYSARRSLQPDNGGYTSSVDDAYDADTITEGDERRLLRADLVYTASVHTDAGWETRWFPVEVSKTIRVKDVTRVAQAAEAIEKVFGQQVQASVVAGTDISRDAKDLAEDAGVKVVLFQIDGEDDGD